MRNRGWGDGIIEMIERDGDTVRIYAARKKALYVFGISTALTLSMYAFNRMGMTQGAEMDWLLVYCLAFCNVVALGFVIFKKTILEIIRMD